MEKTLIYTDLSATKAERESIETYLSNTNAILSIFHSLQTFTTLDNPHAAISFLKTPVATFDGLILKASGIKGAVNPEAVASIFGIDRNTMLNAVASQPAINREPGQMNRTQFYKWHEKYTDLLILDGTSFVLDNEALEKYLEKYCVFAETPAEMEVLKYWEDFCNTFNAHTKKIGFRMLGGQAKYASDLKVEHVNSDSPYLQVKPNKQLVAREVLNSRTLRKSDN